MMKTDDGSEWNEDAKKKHAIKLTFVCEKITSILKNQHFVALLTSYLLCTQKEAQHNDDKTKNLKDHECISQSGEQKYVMCNVANYVIELDFNQTSS